MSKTAVLQMRIDPKLKKDVEKAALHYGLSLSSVINIFLRSMQNDKSTIIQLMSELDTIYLTEKEEKSLNKSINSGIASKKEVQAVFGKNIKF